MDRKVLASAIGVLAIGLSTAAVLRMHSAEREHPPEVTVRTANQSRDAESTFSELRPVAAPALAMTIAADPEAALLAHVEYKYRYLFAEVDPASVDELKRRLLEREGSSSLDRAQFDSRVAELLPAREFAYYRALKDSDLEQHHLAEYAGGVSNVLPLDDRQERQVLDAKLRQKQRYATALRDLGIDRDTLSPAEREYAHAHVAAALKGYLEEFLLEVSPALTPEQYMLLKNYEATEFSRELERLQRSINAK